MEEKLCDINNLKLSTTYISKFVSHTYFNFYGPMSILFMCSLQ